MSFWTSTSAGFLDGNVIRDTAIKLELQPSLTETLRPNLIWINSTGENKQYAFRHCLGIVDHKWSEIVTPVVGSGIEVDEMKTVETEALIEDKFRQVLRNIVGKELTQFGIPLRRGRVFMALSDLNGILADVGGGNHKEGSRKVALCKPSQENLSKAELREEMRNWLVDDKTGMGMSRDLYMKPETILEMRSDAANMFACLSVVDNKLARVDAAPVITEAYVHFPAMLLGNPNLADKYLGEYMSVNGNLRNLHYVAGGIHWPLFVKYWSNYTEPPSTKFPIANNITLQLAGERITEANCVDEADRRSIEVSFPIDQRALSLLETHVAGFGVIGMATGINRLIDLSKGSIVSDIFAKPAKSLRDLPMQMARPIRIPTTATYCVK
jgi:hypothetical protein